jgi:hypothetical protein
MVRKLTLSLELDMSYHVYRSLPLEHILSWIQSTLLF